MVVVVALLLDYSLQFCQPRLKVRANQLIQKPAE